MATETTEGVFRPHAGTLDCDSCGRRGECRVSFEPRIPGPDEDGHDEGCLDWTPAEGEIETATRRHG